MFMLDTDLCIYLINERDQALRGKFVSNARAICTSSITYAELCFGAAHSARIEENMREVEAFCVDLDILPFDATAGTHYGEIRQALTQGGRIIGANDLLIAAHARSAGATLVTNNEREFGRVPGLQMENWLAETSR
ncbi:MAG: type II toxin-antitoxin system VapC family toxin [Gammaproteobacteria bacterium]|nr:type II toxin-antitoxin system VapC family toxin [Gammaproteobacteria bacterium]